MYRSVDQCCGSGSGIRVPVPFWPWTRIRNRFFCGSRIPTPYFLELSDKFLGKKFYNSLKTGPNCFIQHLNNKIVYNFVKFAATKKGLTTNFFFHPSLLLLFLYPGSEFRDPGCLSRIHNTGVDDKFFLSEGLARLFRPLSRRRSWARPSSEGRSASASSPRMNQRYSSSSQEYVILILYWKFFGLKTSTILWKLAQIFFFSISKIHNKQFCEQKVW